MHIRLLKSNDEKSISHVVYWMRSLLQNFLPSLSPGVEAVNTPEYFSIIGQNLSDIMISDLLSTETFLNITNRMIYKDLSDFPITKVEQENVGVNFAVVWKRLHSGIFSLEESECQFLLIHNKLPVPERLHRVGLKDDPHCLWCPGNILGDIPHYFCSCLKTKILWTWLKSIILKKGNFRSVSDLDLLRLSFPQRAQEKAITWLIGSYTWYAWQNARGDTGDELKLEKFFGFLSFKYKDVKSIVGAIDGLG